MEVKLFEVRDVGTTMVIIGIRLGYDAGNAKLKRMLARCGFERPENYILLGDLDSGKFSVTCDQFDYYQSNRTKFVGYGYIKNHWRELPSGSVVDVEFILGESDKPKEPEI